jgi:hypothetical protein
MLKYLILKFKQVSIVLSKIHTSMEICLQCVQKVKTRKDILYIILFGNCNITFKNKPLIFSSGLKSNIETVQDIWDENSQQFIDCDLLYSKLIDRKNCISEYFNIKKSIPKDNLNFLKNENNDNE